MKKIANKRASMRKKEPTEHPKGSKRQTVKWLLFSFLLIHFAFIPTMIYAQHDHDHGDGGHSHGEETAKTEAVKLQKSEAVSDKYEAVLKYEHLHAGEAEKMTL